MLFLPEEAPAMVREFLERNINAISLQLINSIRRRAIRLGIWWRINPLRRGLLEAAIAYLKRGLRFKSPTAIAMIKDAIIEALTQVLTRSTKFMAYIIGTKLMNRLIPLTRRMPRINEVIALGLQWLNTSPIYRTGLNNSTNNHPMPSWISKKPED